MSVRLYDALNASYGNRESKRNIEEKGYKFDRTLSNHNEQTYYNPTDQKLLVTVAGTHNLSDWGTDLLLANGNLKLSKRYIEAKKTLEQARTKYHPKETVVAGHSLGNIASGIASRDDKVYTLDGGYTIGQKTRANTKAYRSQGDVVSLLGANAKHMTTLNQGNVLSRNKYKILGGAIGGFGGLAVGALADAWHNHDLKHIKNENIFI